MGYLEEDLVFFLCLNLPHGGSLHSTYLIEGLVSFLEVEMEIQKRLDGWKLKLEEAEQKYIKLAVASCKPMAKRPRMSKDETWSQLADYTAEVVFEFFLKVM